MTENILGTAALVIRRRIAGPVERVFSAWTDPEQLLRWWGPTDVICTEAHVDLRVGGGYRLANQLPNGAVVWISGTYEAVDPPHLLRFTWSVAPSHGAIAGEDVSLVTVRCIELAGGTEVTVTHERIADNTVREDHARGWDGCLDRLQAMWSA